MNRKKIFGLLMAACLVSGLWQTTAQSLASNKSKETKGEVTLGELKVWLDGKFETIDERFKTIDERFKTIDERFKTIDERFKSLDKQLDERFGTFMWMIGILAGVFVAFSAGTFAFTNHRMDRLEALILKNRDEIALNRTAIEVNKALIEKES